MKNPSSNPLTITAGAEQIEVAGSLVQSTVVAAYDQLVNMLSGKQSLKINLANISVCDSASLALLLALRREADKRKIELMFIRCPQQMLDLSYVSGVTKILSLKE